MCHCVFQNKVLLGATIGGRIGGSATVHYLHSEQYGPTNGAKLCIDVRLLRANGMPNIIRGY